MLNKATQIATKAHEGQKDKAGEPYILHPLRVMLSRKTEIERICSILHDVIEDTEITCEDLRNEGFSEEIIDVLNTVSKLKGESYDDFISRILGNKIACYVEIADLKDNMDLSCIKSPTQLDIEIMKKYERSLSRISEHLKHIEDV